MKIIDTFLFSEPHEQNVLLCKLHSEYDIVDEFIGIESDYDFRMKEKGLYLNRVLAGEQFKPFLDKITVLSNPNSFYPVDVAYDEQNNLQCEFNSRAYCWDYIKNKYDDNDWVLLQDADEMLDFSNPTRRDLILNAFKNETGSIQLFNRRFWWDFDNIAIYEKYIPCHQIGKLKERGFAHRNRDCKTVNLPEVCGFEYSYCFTKTGNWKKVNSASHDKYTTEIMDAAYYLNTWHKEPNRGERLNYPLDFFETIEINEQNSPKFVVDNIDWLRVNTIDPDYGKNRKATFMCHPHPYLQHNLLQGNKIRDDRNYYKG